MVKAPASELSPKHIGELNGVSSETTASASGAGSATSAGRRRTPFAVIGFALALAIGVWARTRGLEVSPLANDEYYFVLSVRQILEHGIPVFETGGAYTRGILVQYLTAPAMLLTSSDELGARIPSVVFGLGVVGVAWLYGCRTLGWPYALVLIVLLLVSSWEVEYSRFGRMYIGFQLATLAMLTALHDTIGGVRGFRTYLVPIFGFAMVTTHALSILMVPLFLLPLLVPGVRERFGTRARAVSYSVACGVVAAFAWFWQEAGFREAGVTNRLPEGFSPSGGNELIPLFFPFWHVSAEPFVNLAALLVLFALTGGVMLWLVRAGRVDGATVAGALMLVAALAHQLLLALLVGLVLVLRFRLPWTLRRHRAAAILFATSVLVAACWVVFAGWMTYSAGSREWIASGGFTMFREAFLAAFLWPTPWSSVISPWIEELPVLSVLFGTALLVQVVLKARRPVVELVRNPAFIALYVLGVMGCVAPPFEVTRYTFFIYPVALALLVLSVKDLSALVSGSGMVRYRTALGVSASLALFAISGDFNPRHLVHVASPEAVYRTGQFEKRETTWYPRDDFAAPARFINSFSNGDPVIVHEAPSISYYVDRPHAVYLDRRAHRFPNVSRERGTVDFWSGQRLLSTGEDVANYTRCAERVWIVRMANERKWLEPGEVWGGRLRDTGQAFVSPDGAVEVLRVDLDPAECPGAEAA